MPPKRQSKKPTKTRKKARASLQSVQPAEDASAVGYHTTPYQIDAMVRWLEIPENYNVIAGNSTKGKTTAHGAGMTKIAGFQKMAEFVHAATIEYMQQNCFFDAKLAVEWEAKQCQSRSSSIVKRYRSARSKLDNQTGFGLTEEMAASGMTVEDLAEETCPFFHRIDKLFGGNANVTPPSAISEPSYNDADWFPVSDGLPSGEDNGGYGDNTPGTQGSSLGVEAGDKENTDPNLQGSPSTSSERSTSATEPASANNAGAHPTPVTSRKKTGTSKQRKSAAKTKATTAADTKGVGKATNQKRKDFGSVYTAASKVRQAFNEQKFTVQMEWKEKMFVKERREKKLERQARDKELEKKADIQRMESRQNMALELLKSGKPLSEVQEIVKAFFPDPTPVTVSNTDAMQQE